MAVQSSTPHDGLFKGICSRKAEIAGILRANLPEPLTARIDFDCLELQPAGFIEQNLRFRQRQFELVTVAAEFPKDEGKVLQFLQDHHASTKNYLFGDDDKYALIEAFDKDWNGELPYTLLQNNNSGFGPDNSGLTIVGYLYRFAFESGARRSTADSP